MNAALRVARRGLWQVGVTNRIRRVFIVALALLAFAAVASAQTTTYHLHNETLPGIGKYVSVDQPDSASVTIQSPDLNGLTSGHYVNFDYYSSAEFQQTATIPAQSTFTYKIWMRKTVATGRLAASASLGTTLDFNSRVEFCRGTASAELTTTLTLYTFSCNTTASVSVNPTRELSLIVSVWANSNINKSVKAEVAIEGVFQGNYDSRVDTPIPPPAPSISTVNPTAAPVNWSVTVSGTNFGGAPGTLKFGGTTATSASWTNTTIVAPVPAGASTGAVTVTTAGGTATGPTFTVIPPPTLSQLIPQIAHRGEAVTINGNSFFSATGSAVTFNGVAATPSSWSDTTILTTVPATATTGNVVVTVSEQASNSLPFTVLLPGTISGTITKATDATALQGATVQAVLTGVIKATATSAVNGTYSIGNLDPGTYDLRVLASGYSSEVRSLTLANGGTLGADVAMSRPGSIGGLVTAGGVTPLVGAAVTMFLNGIQKGSGSTDASGNYSLSGLHPGSYTLQVVDVGYRTKEQGVVINDNASTTANVSLDAAPAGPVSYAYDPLGRLASVVDPSGDAATYTYDAVGNILSIGRIGAGTVAITQVTPNSAAVNTPVTIYGTGFSSTPSENVVTFPNNKPAVVTSSTATTIVTSVPANADLAAGEVAVAAPIGSATKPFTVTGPTAAPSISSFSPSIASAGTTVTISGTNFDATAANDRVTLNQTLASPSVASPTSLTVTVPSGTTSGPISVSTSYGAAVSATDLIVPPSGYTAESIDFTGRVGFGDPGARTIPVNTSGKIALALFDGIAGRRASFKVSAVSYSGGTVTILSPYGAQLATASYLSDGVFVDTKVLPVTGTYTVVIAPTSPSTGSVLLTVYDVVDFSSAIVPGGDPVTANVDTPGQKARYVFAATAGQRVSVNVTNVTLQGPFGCKGDVSVVDANNIKVRSTTCLLTGGDSFVDVTDPLPAGTYRIVFDPESYATGDATLKLYAVPPDLSGTIVPGGDPVTVTIDPAAPGQNASLTFTASDQQRISLNMTQGTWGGFGTCNGVTIRRPDGSTLVSNSCFLSSGGFIDVQPLSPGGVYTILLDPGGAATGSLTLQLYDVPPDFPGTLLLNDPNDLSVPIMTPGQNASVTFTLATSQSVRVHIGNNPFLKCTTVKLMQGTTTIQTTTSCESDFFTAPQSLSAGSYTVVIDPPDVVTATFLVRLVSP